jgi:hypothetical protein
LNPEALDGAQKLIEILAIAGGPHKSSGLGARSVRVTPGIR